jgi:hypothetical protein
MMDMIRDDLALLGINHDLFSSEAELQAAGKPEEAEAWLRSVDLVYDGELEAPKGKLPDDWELWRCRCSAAPSLATIRTARSRSRMATGPISAPIWPITIRKRRPPTPWSTSGARTMPAPSSASRRLWRP